MTTRKEIPKKKAQSSKRKFVGHYIYLEYTIGLPKRARYVARALADWESTFATLYADENFVTLLRAESLATFPARLSRLLPREKSSCR